MPQLRSNGCKANQRTPHVQHWSAPASIRDNVCLSLSLRRALHVYGKVSASEQTEVSGATQRPPAAIRRRADYLGGHARLPARPLSHSARHPTLPRQLSRPRRRQAFGAVQGPAAVASGREGRGAGPRRPSRPGSCAQIRVGRRSGGRSLGHSNRDRGTLAGRDAVEASSVRSARSALARDAGSRTRTRNCWQPMTSKRSPKARGEP